MYPFCHKKDKNIPKNNTILNKKKNMIVKVRNHHFIKKLMLFSRLLYNWNDMILKINFYFYFLL
jgi:hypothetical protein